MLVPRAAAAPGRLFQRLYSIVVAVKGFDGVVEVVAGIILLVSPTGAAALLIGVASELAEGTSPLRLAAARSLATTGTGLEAGAAPFAVFLLVHGVVKLLTVYCLLRRALRWYPWALAALVVLLVLQTVDLVASPGFGVATLVVLDVLVIAIVGWEYRYLRREGAVTVERASGAADGA